MVSFTLPHTASAGIFSFVTDLFKSTDTVSAETKGVQNMPLLQAALNPDTSAARGGGEITIVEGSSLLPESGPVGASLELSDVPPADQISVYVVRKGDTLSEIAKMFNVSVNTIIWGNDLRGSTIKIGQTLVILPVSGVKYTVVKGDTVNSIAKKFKADTKEILAFNDLPDNGSLSVGSTIIIPDGEMAAPVSSSSSRTIKGDGSSPLIAGYDGPNYTGYYTSPLSYYTRTQGLHGYNAVDMADPIGTPVMAAAGGEVIISREGGWNGGYGNYVVIKHDNGTQTLYAHLSGTIVYVGQKVVQGQVIGYVGNTGKSTGPHLHFEIRGAVNPF